MNSSTPCRDRGHSTTRPLRLVVSAGFVAALYLACGAALAQSDFEEDFDDPYKPWQEVALQLPAAPQEQDLIPFDVGGPAASYAFAIDSKSLSVGSDGVVRYTVVSVSNAGARNVTYEGLRCSSKEYKTYAFGHPDGSWSRSRRDKWEDMARTRVQPHRDVLVREYFCQEGSVAGKAELIIYRMRNRISLAPGQGR